MPPTGPQSPHPYIRLVVFAALVLLGGSALALYLFRPSPALPPNATPTDPRLAYTGPYRNVHPDVTTVGSDRCLACHADVGRVYAHHPMGRSILPVADQPIGDLAERGHATFTALGSRFRIERDGSKLRYTETRTGTGGETLYEMTTLIGYVVGSGTKGHSFLSVRDGFVTQDAVSWFTQKHIWDESPGYSPDLHAGRPIRAGCLYCHANEVVPVAGTENKFELPLFRNGSAIGCERCHGPGSEHVRAREAGAPVGRPDYTIVNPKPLDAPLREAVCQQCHLAGEARVPRAGLSASDFRPGLPLDAVLRVMVLDHHGADRKAVNHVEQMYLSKCYVGSGGQLGCTTCHDPHEKAPVEIRTERYRAACLKCHDCTSPVAERTRLGAPNNCTSCHMPQFAAKDIAHAATTDHRIVRTREAPKPALAPQSRPRAPLFFPNRRPDFESPADVRDYGVGLVEMAKSGKTHPGEAARDALPLLERAIANAPDDFRAWEAKSYTLQLAGRKSEALAATQTVLSLVPNHEGALTSAAQLAAETDQPQQALDYWKRAVAVNPVSAHYRQELATVLARGGNWTAAAEEAREALRLDPATASARTIVAISERRAGNQARAEELMQTVEQLKPPNLGQLRDWYRFERREK